MNNLEDIDLYNNFLPNLKISLSAIYVNDEPIISPKDFIFKKRCKSKIKPIGHNKG